MAKVTQKEFVEAVREVGDTRHLCGISYQYPGFFQVGEKKIQLEIRKVSRFLAKLSTVMSFNHYDKLARIVWVASLQVPADPYARTRPEFTANPSKPKNVNTP